MWSIRLRDLKWAKNRDEQAARVRCTMSRIPNSGLSPLAVPPRLPLIVIGRLLRMGEGILGMAPAGVREDPTGGCS